MSGRHRKAPGGHRRYLAGALGVFVVVVLVATGGYSLYSVLALSSPPNQVPAAAPGPRAGGPAESSSAPQPSASPRPTQNNSGGQRTFSGSQSRPPILALTVTGARSYVMVRKPGGKVLLNRTLGRGETARFGQQALVVTVGAPKSVRIRVNGEPRKPARRGIDTFKVSRQD